MLGVLDAGANRHADPVSHRDRHRVADSYDCQRLLLVRQLRHAAQPDLYRAGHRGHLRGLLPAADLHVSVLSLQLRVDLRGRVCGAEPYADQFAHDYANTDWADGDADRDFDSHRYGNR